MVKLRKSAVAAVSTRVPAGGVSPASTETPSFASDDVPATAGMLRNVRTELLLRIDQSREEARADHLRLNAKVISVEAKVDAVDAKIDAVKADLQGQMFGMQAQMTRIEVLVEEQNARNQVVLDGIAALLSRQNQVEERVDRVEAMVRTLVAR